MRAEPGLYNASCLDHLGTMPDRSVQCAITSPPYYGLRDYGVSGQYGQEATPQEYVARQVAVFAEVHRVLRDDGTLWLNLGDSYASGKGTCHNPGGGKDSLGQRRKKAGVHPLDRGNVSDLREQGLKPKDLIGIPWRVALALQAEGWYLRNDIIWHKPNPMPESVRDRCTKSHEYIFLLTKSARYYYDAESIKETAVTKDPRRPYTSRGAKDMDGRKEWHGGETRGGDFGLRNKRDVWTLPVIPYKGAHFATFPEALVEPCVLAGSKVGDVVLDPFSGAGTVGVVCKQRGRDYIGVELNPEYVELSRKRIESTVAITTRTFL